MNLKQRIEQANAKVLEILVESQPVWKGCRRALGVIPGMKKNLVLHAGPPIAWEKMCQPMRNGIAGAIILEELAEDYASAEALVLSGDVDFAPCHHYDAVGGMTGITSASMPVHVVHNETAGNTAYSVFHEGPSVKGFGWGTFDDGTLDHMRWMRDELAPVLHAALELCGGINMSQLIARGIQMGDEAHGRCGGVNALIIRTLAPYLPRLRHSKTAVERVFKFLGESDIFALHVIMGAGKSMVDAAKGIPFSTIVTTMARNGIEFGIRVSALGDQWFTGPAQPIRTVFFSPDWTDDDAVDDLGDSSITETIGLGGMIMAASPEQEYVLGGTYADALRKTEDAYKITAGEHRTWKIPALDFRGVPLGIDIRKVLDTGLAPNVNTATAHIDGGMIGIGDTKAPIEAFEAAFMAFSNLPEVRDLL